ncbi:hypothetical protein TGAM01_v205498 [Trichoderma gamsii]|uniref:Heterokaryon incompatibility domain-containing protein n=1 Tax=Trichoderma gamsii TaxID=398673 RepID=A0A2P4ZMV6_9HYPO|nr:hypothetical protein TGAM01_v205498 [Trichoderma gamsii]PON25613.1 hypothetical protein TGAM01_v205498 [Trichoderma gamsii]
MMNIYSRASQVIVWLEESIEGTYSGDTSQAIEEIGRAADGRLTKSSNDKAIRKILQRSWFQRIWVLQEVAAARHVLIMCHSIEIDGDAFCAGLTALNLTLKDPELQNRIRSAIYLIKNAGLRPKHIAGSFDKFSLDRRSMGELVDMYHNRDAKDWRDKIYALLGMGVEIPPGLTPNYNTPWKDLFHKLVSSFTGEQASIKTWNNQDFAIIKTHGRVIGTVSSISTSDAWDDKHNVGVNIHLEKDSDSDSYYKEEHSVWTMQASAKLICRDDIICFVPGASNPMIVRPCEDYFDVIIIAATPRHLSLTSCRWPETSPHRELLLLWNWGLSPETLGDYEGFLNGRVPGYMDHLGKAARLHCIGQLFKDAGLYRDAVDRFEKSIEAYHTPHGGTYLQSLPTSTTYSLERKAEKLAVAADILGRRGDYVEVTEHGIIQIAELHDTQMMKLLQHHHDGQIPITEDILKAAVGNSSSGEALTKLLLSQSSDINLITEEVMKTAALKHGNSLAVMKLLLNWCGDQAPVTEEVVKAAAANDGTGYEIIQLLLNRYGDRVPITLKIVQYIAKNCRVKVMELLLDRFGDQIPVSEEVMLAAARNTKDFAMMRLLFERRGFSITRKIRKPLIERYCTLEDRKRFISQYGHQLPLTNEVVTMAGSRYAKDLMVLLLDRSQDQNTITERAMKHILYEFIGIGDVIKMLLDRHGDQIPVTERIVKIITEKYDRQIMKLLLDRRGNEILFTKEVLEAAAKNKSSGEEVVMELLKRYQNQVSVNTDVAKFIAGHFNEQVMRFFLDLCGEQVPIDEEVMKAAAENRYGEKVITVLISRQKQTPITEEVVKVAAKNASSGIFESLLNWLGDQAPITKEVVAAAVGNEATGDRLLLFLLDKYGDRAPVTKEVATIAARNRNYGIELLTLLLDRRGDQVPINEEVMIAAARNENHGVKLITLLLDERGDQVSITEEVVTAAAGNYKSGKEIMTILHDRRDHTPITEGAVIAAAENQSWDKEVLGLLLNWRGDETPVTESVVKAAAGNKIKGWRLLGMLFDWFGDQTPTSEEVVKAAAANRGDEKVMELLLDRGGPQLPITEEVIKAAAGNSFRGEQVMKQLLFRREEVVKAAAGNRRKGEKVTAFLLREHGDEIIVTDDIMKAAAGNEESGEEVMALLLDHRGD